MSRPGFWIKRGERLFEASSWDMICEWAQVGRLKLTDQYSTPQTRGWREVRRDPTLSGLVPKRERLILRRGSQEYSAPNYEVIQDWARRGQVSPDDMIYSSYTQLWAKVSDLPSITQLIPDYVIQRNAERAHRRGSISHSFEGDDVVDLPVSSPSKALADALFSINTSGVKTTAEELKEVKHDSGESREDMGGDDTTTEDPGDITSAQELPSSIPSKNHTHSEEVLADQAREATDELTRGEHDSDDESLSATPPDTQRSNQLEERSPSDHVQSAPLSTPNLSIAEASTPSTSEPSARSSAMASSEHEGQSPVRNSEDIPHLVDDGWADLKREPDHAPESRSAVTPDMDPEPLQDQVIPDSSEMTTETLIPRLRPSVEEVTAICAPFYDTARLFIAIKDLRPLDHIPDQSRLEALDLNCQGLSKKQALNAVHAKLVQHQELYFSNEADVMRLEAHDLHAAQGQLIELLSEVDPYIGVVSEERFVIGNENRPKMTSQEAESMLRMHACIEQLIRCTKKYKEDQSEPSNIEEIL